MASPIEDLCKKVIDARSAKDELKAKLDEASSELVAMESSLASLMRESEKTSIVQAGMVFSPTLKVSWKVQSADKERLVGFLKQGAPELVKETVNSSSLSSYLRKNEASLDSDSADWWVSAKTCLDRSENAGLSIRKQPKKKAK